MNVSSKILFLVFFLAMGELSLSGVVTTDVLAATDNCVTVSQVVSGKCKSLNQKPVRCNAIPKRLNCPKDFIPSTGTTQLAFNSDDGTGGIDTSESATVEQVLHAACNGMAINQTCIYVEYLVCCPGTHSTMIITSSTLPAEELW